MSQCQNKRSKPRVLGGGGYCSGLLSNCFILTVIWNCHYLFKIRCSSNCLGQSKQFGVCGPSLRHPICEPEAHARSGKSLLPMTKAVPTTKLFTSEKSCPQGTESALARFREPHPGSVPKEPLVNTTHTSALCVNLLSKITLLLQVWLLHFCPKLYHNTQLFLSQIPSMLLTCKVKDQ